MRISDFMDGFISLFYPSVCASCGNTLFKNEDTLCAFCLYHLPKTNFHTMDNSPLDQVFWGRVNLQHTAALYTFSKKGNVQHLIHQLKYKNRPDVGIYMGKILGKDLLESNKFNDVQVIVPVPLHKRRQGKRGYNQSEQIAIGMAYAMKIEMDTTSFLRTVNTSTQTRKSRFARWENVKEVFVVSEPTKLAGKHILLIDDVITTGATLEAAAQMLLAIEGVSLSIACIGFARD